MSDEIHAPRRDASDWKQQDLSVAEKGGASPKGDPAVISERHQRETKPPADASSDAVGRLRGL